MSLFGSGMTIQVLAPPAVFAGHRAELAVAIDCDEDDKEIEYVGLRFDDDGEPVALDLSVGRASSTIALPPGVWTVDAGTVRRRVEELRTTQ